MRDVQALAIYLEHYQSERMREAEAERLASLARGECRQPPLREQLAEVLRAIARRVEPTPQLACDCFSGQSAAG